MGAAQGFDLDPLPVEVARRGLTLSSIPDGDG
jgi:hypothetical protein